MQRMTDVLSRMLHNPTDGPSADRTSSENQNLSENETAAPSVDVEQSSAPQNQAESSSSTQTTNSQIQNESTCSIPDTSSNIKNDEGCSSMKEESIVEKSTSVDESPVPINDTLSSTCRTDSSQTDKKPSFSSDSTTLSINTSEATDLSKPSTSNSEIDSSISAGEKTAELSDLVISSPEKPNQDLERDNKNSDSESCDKVSVNETTENSVEEKQTERNSGPSHHSNIEVTKIPSSIVDPSLAGLNDALNTLREEFVDRYLSILT